MSVASEIERLEAGKAGIVASIRAKGVEVADTDKLGDLPTKIDAIESAPEGLSEILFDVTGVRESPILPSGYTELRYIESTGTQYIDTGVYPNEKTGFDLDLEILSSTNVNHLMSVNTPSGIYCVIRLNTSGGSNVFQSRFGKQSAKTIPHDREIVGRHVIKARGKTFSVDDVQEISFNDEVFQSEYSYPLFAVELKTGIDYENIFRCYGLKFYEGDEKTKELIPCINPSGQVGMYDLIGGDFYGNSGTGSFVAGPSV